MPSQKSYTFAIRTSQRLTKNYKRVCLANTQETDGKNKAHTPNKGSYVMRGLVVKLKI